MDDLLAEFLTEAQESLASLDEALLALERTPGDRGTVGLIFRLVHTIKGTCGFLGLGRLERVAHAAENVLGLVREGARPATPGLITLVLQAADVMKAIVTALGRTGAEPEGDDSAVIAGLDAMFEGREQEGVGELAVDTVAAVVEAVPARKPRRRRRVGGARGGGTGAVAAVAGVGVAEVGGGEVGGGEAVVADAGPGGAGLNGTGSGGGGPAPAVAVTVDAERGPAFPLVVEASGGASAESRVELVAGDGGLAAQTIRVSVGVLENLMTLVSELVLTRNQLLQISRGSAEAVFAAPVQRLSQITSDLQEGVMKTRMQPIGSAWSKLPRLVRDLGQELGKQIELRMLGAETEIDRQVLEAVRDPLTHMVRNSGDHGLEGPAERREAGKPAVGTITLNAYHEGGHVIVEIADDGRGLPLDRIRAKVVAHGLASEAEVAAMAPAALHRFIFHPGFSTAPHVTSVSGRGVGMDVVRTNIEKIGGTIELDSRSGEGTTCTIKIPLTLAIVSALIVEAGGERFAIAQSSVAELVHAQVVQPGAEGKPGQADIEQIDGTSILRLRQRLLPLVTLSALLRLPGMPQARGQGPGVYVVVVSAGSGAFGIVVDRVFDTEEIVVKPVSPVLRDIPLFSGNTVLGDGAVIMILDPNGIAREAKIAAGSGGRPMPVSAAGGMRSEDETSILIFRAGSPAPKAVPLSLVARLERFAAARVEEAGGRLVTQYGGRLMPLLPFAPGFDKAARAEHPVLVFTEQDRSVGLLVDEIVDVVQDRLVVEIGERSPGLLGTAVVAGAATEIVDTAHWLALAGQDWFRPDRDKQARRLLVVEDSAFFRNMLVPALASAGYHVTAVKGALEALGLRNAGTLFDAIISDIEMPGMDGLAFARAARAEGAWAGLPLIALSGRANASDVEAGLAAGFTHYMPKFEREALLDRLARCMAPQVREAA